MSGGEHMTITAKKQGKKSQKIYCVYPAAWNGFPARLSHNIYGAQFV
jgi:hypothetical protein